MFLKFSLSFPFFYLVPSHAIRCYDCTVLTCPLFNESRSYEVDCPNSTMCLKRIYPYKLTTGETLETFERSCANQLDKSMVCVCNILYTL